MIAALPSGRPLPPALSGEGLPAPRILERALIGTLNNLMPFPRSFSYKAGSAAVKPFPLLIKFSGEKCAWEGGPPLTLLESNNRHAVPPLILWGQRERGDAGKRLQERVHFLAQRPRTAAVDDLHTLAPG